MTDIHASEEPNDRLGFIAAEMLNALNEHEDVRGIVMLASREPDDTQTKGMLAMSGYEDHGVAMTDLYEQFKVLCSHNGTTVVLIPVQGPSPN